jgi:multidrug efflux pump subunit AcrA (membrane-fusion protein)
VRLISILLVWLIGIAALALALGLAFGSAYRAPDSRLWATDLGYPTLARRFDWPIPVETEIVAVREIVASVAAEGALEFEKLVPVAIDLPGIVASVDADVGQSVRKGETVLTLDLGGREVRLAKLDVRLKEEAYDAAVEIAAGRRQLHDQGLTSYDDLYTYEREERDAQAALLRAQESLKLALSTRSEAVFKGLPENPDINERSRLNILSPIDGQILQIRVAEGETIVAPRAGAVAVGAEMRFRAFVDQMHFGAVSVGQDATVHLLARPNGSIPAKVERIEPFVAGEAEARTTVQPPQTFVVWLEVPPSYPAMSELARGMNGYVILSDPAEEMVISSKALLRYSGGTGVVLVVDDHDKLWLRSVEYTWSDGVKVAIESGLEVGERIVTAGQVALRQGDWVQPN